MNAVRLPESFEDPCPTERIPLLEVVPPPPTRREPLPVPGGALPATGAPGGLMGALRADLLDQAFEAAAKALAKVKRQKSR